MARIRSWPGKQEYPAFGGVVEFKTRKGQIVVSTWPRKRGKKATARQKLWREWFTQANHLAKVCDPEQQRLAKEYTQGTGLYPRDLLLMMMSRGLVDIIDGGGAPIISKQWRLENVTWQGFIIEANTPISVGVGVATSVTWPLPVLQTLPFWDVGSPTIITIPTGVEIMEFQAGYKSTGGGNADDTILIRNKTTLTQYGAASGRTPAQGAEVTVSGPVLVTPGDQWDIRVFMGSGGTLTGDPNTFFKGTILQATVP